MRYLKFHSDHETPDLVFDVIVGTRVESELCN